MTHGETVDNSKVGSAAKIAENIANGALAVLFFCALTCVAAGTVCFAFDEPVFWAAVRDVCGWGTLASGIVAAVSVAAKIAAEELGQR